MAIVVIRPGEHRWTVSLSMASPEYCVALTGESACVFFVLPMKSGQTYKSQWCGDSKSNQGIWREHGKGVQPVEMPRKISRRTKPSPSLSKYTRPVAVMAHWWQLYHRCSSGNEQLWERVIYRALTFRSVMPQSPVPSLSLEASWSIAKVLIKGS